MDAISEYQKWKQQGESLRAQAKQAMEGRFRDLLVEAAQIAQDRATVVKGVGVIRPQRDRAVEPGQRLFLPVGKFFQNVTRIGADAGIAGIQRMGLPAIQQRLLEPARSGRDLAGARHATALAEADAQLIRRADTFFLGTVHPERGADASHRGGPAGFVRLDGASRLWWPDYQGNNLFNSLGNLAVDPEAALLFFNFHDGQALQLSGTAGVEWDHAGEPGDDAGTGRKVVAALAACAIGVATFARP